MQMRLIFGKCYSIFSFEQWCELKNYANERGIRIIGDVPIYVAGDSVDVWTNPSQFYLDENLEPIDVAGCPPDAFSADGTVVGKSAVSLGCDAGGRLQLVDDAPS